MISRRFIQPALVATVFGMGAAAPALAQVGVPAISSATWNYDDLYRSGWSAERLMDETEVIGANGEEIGDIENIIISRQGRILGIIAEVGGFWDIGDTHVFIPWDQVRVSPNLDRAVVPVTEENVDNYAYGANDVLTYFRAGVAQVVDDDLDTGPSIWKATDLIDDYAYLNNRRAYGYINDLIFSTDGSLRAVIVNAGSAWGGGYRALPFYYNARWNPGETDYYLGYGENDVVNLDRFDYNRLPNRVMVNNQTGTGGSMQAMGNRTNVTGAVPTQWTFRDVDADSNLELTGREFSQVSGNIYIRWDVNRDMRLAENEFYTGLYNVFDYDRDRRVSENEFNQGWRNWGISNLQVSYGTLDANGDGFLDVNEFRTGFDRVGYYDRWDTDRNGWLVENEFNTGMYDVWDADSDGVLAQNEFGELAQRNWF